MTAQVIGSHSPVMGRNVHIIFREFQEVIGSGYPDASHKENIVLLSLFACVQVTSMHSMIVKTVAGMTCSLQGLPIDTMTMTTIPTS